MEIGDGNPTKYEEVEQKIGQIFVPKSQVSREKVFSAKNNTPRKIIFQVPLGSS